jgi:hypothetical protein
VKSGTQTVTILRNRRAPESAIRTDIRSAYTSHGMNDGPTQPGGEEPTQPGDEPTQPGSEDPTRRIPSHEPPTEATRAMPHDVAPPGSGPQPKPPAPPAGGEPTGDGDGGSKLPIIIGALVAAIAGVVVAVLLIAGGDGEGPKTVTATGTTTVTQTQTTQTTETSEPTISQPQAAAAAQSAASETAGNAGLRIPPADFDTQCTAEGGTSQASTWNCQVTSQDGQCSGPVTVVATANETADVQDNQVACAGGPQ